MGILGGHCPAAPVLSWVSLFGSGAWHVPPTSPHLDDQGPARTEHSGTAWTLSQMAGAFPALPPPGTVALDKLLGLPELIWKAGLIIIVVI